MSTLWEKKEKYRRFSSHKDSISKIFGGGRKEYLPYTRKYTTLSHEELISLIEDADKEKWEVLDLSNTGISNLPDELWTLTSLKVLYIGNEFSRHTSIINTNDFHEIPDGIQKLTNLEALSICALKNVSVSKFVKFLPKLVYLDCFGCEFVKFPNNLINKKLQSIGIDCENEQVLERICTIKGLRELYLTWSKITILPDDICNLKKLEKLYLAKSKLKKIPNELCNLTKLNWFYIGGTPLEKEIPEEILEQSALETISYICRQQTEDKQYYCNESKMIIVGQGNVGKSCLLERICENKYEEKESTEGIAIRKWTYKDYKKDIYKLNIWDFGGQEIYHSTHQFFLTKRSLYIFVWDARAEEEYGRVDYWLKTIESFAEDSPIIIAINKCDYSTNRINRIDFEAYTKKYPQIKAIMDISCKDNINISILRNKIKKEAKKLPIMKIKWFYEWYQIRMKLEKLSEDKKYISYSEYRDICIEYNLEKKEIASLSKYLHDLGIILHYEDDYILKGIIILAPEWATEAVYKILDSQETILKNRNGILKISDLPEIWIDNDLYPEDKYVFLLKIMEKFQLCFEVAKGEYLVAELLENTALPIPDNWKFKVHDTIRIVYQYDFMPAGVMTRFIVAANQYLAIDQEGRRLCWKKGAYMKYKKAYASVIMTDDISEKKIEVKVNKSSNANDARELLQYIRQKLREINSNFKKMVVKEFVPCNCNTDCDFKYPYETLCMALEKGQETIQCYKSFENVNVLSLLEGIEIKKTEERNSMYTIKVENNPVVTNAVTLKNTNTASQKPKMTVINEVNIHTIFNEVQGDLQELMEELDTIKNSEIITEITRANEDLEELEKVDEESEIIKSGKLNKLKRLIEGFASEDGEYKKLVSGSKNIAKIITGLVLKYNHIAEKLGISVLPF